MPETITYPEYAIVISSVELQSANNMKPDDVTKTGFTTPFGSLDSRYCALFISFSKSFITFWNIMNAGAEGCDWHICTSGRY